jgi:hypothetical protein
MRLSNPLSRPTWSPAVERLCVPEPCVPRLSASAWMGQESMRWGFRCICEHFVPFPRFLLNSANSGRIGSSRTCKQRVLMQRRAGGQASRARRHLGCGFPIHSELTLNQRVQGSSPWALTPYNIE